MDNPRPRRSLFRRLRSRGSRGAMVLMLGTVIGQLITLGVTPLLTRMYSAEDFGYLSLVVSAASILAPAAAMRLESALMLPRSSRDATALLCIGGVSALIVSVVTAGALELLFMLGLLDNMASLMWFSVWVASVVFLTAIFTLLSQFALRRHDYRAVGLRSVYQSVLAAGAQLGFGVVSPTAPGLIGGYVLGRLAGIVPLTLSLRQELRRFTAADSRRVLREYWRFPLLFAPSSMMNAAGLVLPVLFIGAWFSVSEAGQWAIAERVLAAPLVLVATAAGQVVEAHISEMYREGRPGMERYYLKVSGLLTVIALAMVFVIVVVGPWGLPLLLGHGWETAAELMIAMTPMVATRLIASPMSKVLIVLQEGFWTITLDTLRIAAVAGVIVAAVAYPLELTTTAWVFSFVLAAVYVATWGVGWAVSRRGVPVLMT